MARLVLDDGETFGAHRGKLNLNFEELYTQKAETSQVLTKTNTNAYSPSSNYHPATKLYCDDIQAAIIARVDPQNIGGDAFDRANHTGTQGADTITQDLQNRFVSDLQIANWNAKEDAIGVKKSAFNVDFGTSNIEVARGDHTHTKGDLGLGNVDNTADVDKPVSTLQQTALDLKADKSDTYTESEVDTLLLLKRDALNSKFGDGINYAEFETDGTLKFVGTSTVWEDVTFPLISARLYSTTGTLDYNYANATVTMQQSGGIADENDTFIFNIQIPHKTKAGSTAKLHIHWEQAGSNAYTFDLQYRVQRNGQTASGWSTTQTVDMTNNVFTYSSGTIIQITPLLDIDLTSFGISDLIQVKLTRSDATGTPNIEAIAVDCHFEIDSLGSREPYTK